MDLVHSYPGLRVLYRNCSQNFERSNARRHTVDHFLRPLNVLTFGQVTTFGAYMCTVIYRTSNSQSTNFAILHFRKFAIRSCTLLSRWITQCCSVCVGSFGWDDPVVGQGPTAGHTSRETPHSSMWHTLLAHDVTSEGGCRLNR